MKYTCPVCGKVVEPKTKSSGAEQKQAEKAAFPFCCGRCKLIDLGLWLDSEYRIPSDEMERGGESDNNQSV